MRHKWFQNSDEFNFNLNAKKIESILALNLLSSQQSSFLFSHVPKTGGTSMEAILAKNFLLSDIIHVNAPDLNKQPELLSLKKNYPKLICGHHPMHGFIYQTLPEQPLFHLTQLRDPVDRVISYYNYIHSKKDHPLHPHTQNKSITDFILSAPSPELSNGQCKRFSGYLHSETPNESVLLTVAQNTLRDYFSLVLTTCLFDEGLLLLKNRLNLKDIYYQRSNVSTKIIKRDELSDKELNLIINHNQADMALFDWAKAQCLDLIQRELTPVMIDTFREKNNSWNQLIEG